MTIKLSRNLNNVKYIENLNFYQFCSCFRHTRECRDNSLKIGRDYSTVDGRSKRKCYWTRVSSDCGRIQIGDVTREVECMSNDYTNPNTNPKTLTTLALTLTEHRL